MSSVIIVYTTTGQSADAQRIAAALVEQRLAACVQIDGPITSWYRWQGKIESAQEWRLAIKCRADAYPLVESAIRSLHPYEQPEIVAVPLSSGSAGYLQWIEEETAH